ncbi:MULTISPECIES: hypothetical protein [unclassified Chelatococcus]|uniref:hypothetical protein n=1 Tax=unclassified Chelatococcus TaxID=2638111 RepID=UPI001BCE8CDA|nr:MULTISPECIES: hypothetical protein [unclassified Chelatococcus]MBS7743691.1 hypothetical protein [Chelatococcus sp. HY11]MBX3547202.1 hypothetical protein [Chelatococcus sp.]CAH1665143.1 conserved hypothetical protein [Hyphomicrobiales bacterium]CAH1688749.1 conserved hypothetical protein [Hyphomicrobiales bacterium]
MGDFPLVRAEGANIEIELEKGLRLVAYIGDPDVAMRLAELWSLKDSMAVRIARLEARLRELGPLDCGHDDVRPLLASLRRQIDDFETQSRLIDSARRSLSH